MRFDGVDPGGVRLGSRCHKGISLWNQIPSRATLGESTTSHPVSEQSLEGEINYPPHARQRQEYWFLQEERGEEEDLCHPDLPGRESDRSKTDQSSEGRRTMSG